MPTNVTTGALIGGQPWTLRNEDAARDVVRGFVARQLGTGGVLIFDETGDLKKGTATAGIGRQYRHSRAHLERDRRGLRHLCH
jgi:SRSO17 transposase